MSTTLPYQSTGNLGRRGSPKGGALVEGGTEDLLEGRANRPEGIHPANDRQGAWRPASWYKKSPVSEAPYARLRTLTIECPVLLRPATAALGQWRREGTRKIQVRQWTNPIRSPFTWLSCRDSAVSWSSAQEKPLAGTRGAR